MNDKPLRLHGALIAPMAWRREPGLLESHEARTPFGVYRVHQGREGPVRAWLSFDGTISSPGKALLDERGAKPATIQSALDLAQTDYERRVTALLVPVPAAIAGHGDLVMRLRRQPEDEGGPSRMDMLRERLEAADEIERLRGPSPHRKEAGHAQSAAL